MENTSPAVGSQPKTSSFANEVGKGMLAVALAQLSYDLIKWGYKKLTEEKKKD